MDYFFKGAPLFCTGRGMQQRLNDCYRQQRFPYPGFGSDATIALGVYLGVNSKGSASIAPAIKR